MTQQEFYNYLVEEEGLSPREAEAELYRSHGATVNPMRGKNPIGFTEGSLEQQIAAYEESPSAFSINTPARYRELKANIDYLKNQLESATDERQKMDIQKRLDNSLKLMNYMQGSPGEEFRYEISGVNQGE